MTVLACLIAFAIVASIQGTIAYAWIRARESWLGNVRGDRLTTIQTAGANVLLAGGGIALVLIAYWIRTALF